MVASIIQRFCWRGLGVVVFYRYSWNKQFDAGLWCRGQRNPHTLSRVADLCSGGKLIEFGCGEGTLPHQLPPGTFSDYCGFDISDVAIRAAREKARNAGLQRCKFERCDMATWEGSDSASLILAEECIYYLTPARIQHFCRVCSASLLPRGAILIIVHSGTKHARSLEACRSVCTVMDENIIDGRVFLTLAAKET